ncbi:hypothetical protein BDZ89DRAFT_1070864 [Hymenopellis radicata]|nr:hypothetical protein BDZ89DRAFT_1070864 [Hymenopellis radicata]
MGFQDLPEELLISIFNHLSAFELNSCQRTCRFINDIISNSLNLRYQVALEMYGMAHNPNCTLDIAECLRRLERHEEAWGTLTPVFTRTLDVENNVSGIYELSGGTYFLGASKERTIPFLRLPTDSASPTHWDTLRVDGEVVDIGIALYEHDLFAAIVLDPSPILKIKLYIQDHTVARLAVGVEITGDLLVLVTREMVLDVVPDTVYVYNWKQGTILKEMWRVWIQRTANPCKVSRPRLSHSHHHRSPQSRRAYTRDMVLGHSSTNDPLVSFDLPALKDGIEISHMACRGSPNPNAMSKDPDTLRRPVPWQDWGPGNTFWMASGNIDWITTTSGQRHVMSREHGLYLFDFNPIAVRMAKRGMYKGNNKVVEGEHSMHDVPFMEILGARLPFVMNCTQLPPGIDGVLMDEERIMCLKRNHTGRIAQIEMMYFG